MAKPIPASMAAPAAKPAARPRSMRMPENPDPKAFFTQEQADAMLAAKDAASCANPAEVRRAMLAIPRKVKGVSIRVVTLGDYLLLEEMGSPLLEDGRTPTYFDVVAAAYVLAHAPETGADKWAEGAKEHRRTVTTWAGRCFAPSDFSALTVAVTAAIFIGFSTGGEDSADPAKKKPRRSLTGGR